MIIRECGLEEAGVPVWAAGSHKRKKILSRISASLFKGRAHKAGSERLRCDERARPAAACVPARVRNENVPLVFSRSTCPGQKCRALK